MKDEIIKIIIQAIDDKSNQLYPEIKIKDIDGDYSDINKKGRESYIEGALFGIKLMKALYISSKK